jgi:uncharacterized protein YndB with AHSA1/START domain
MTDAQRIVPAPIRKVMRVRASRERAFDVFTAQIGAWWLRTHSTLRQVSDTPQVDVVIEPRTGGRWYEIGEDGTQYDWGRVLAWDPPARLMLAWQLTNQFAYDPDFETEVEIRFDAEGEETVVTFEHRHLDRFGDRAAIQRDGMDEGWGRLLAAYEAKVAG